MELLGFTVTWGHVITGLIGLILGGAIADFIWCAIKTPKYVGIRLIIYGVLGMVGGLLIHWLAGTVMTISFTLVLAGVGIFNPHRRDKK